MASIPITSWQTDGETMEIVTDFIFGGCPKITADGDCSHEIKGRLLLEESYDQPAAAAAAKSLQSCPTLCDPIDGSPPGSPSLGFSRQEHWSGLPFPSPCMKVKSESEVTESCPTLSDPMDCSLPGSSIHGIFRSNAQLEQLHKLANFTWGCVCVCVTFAGT